MADTVPAVRWGIVGTGGIADLMSQAIEAAGSAELAAIASRRLDSAQAFASRHGIARAFDAWADMVASDDIDAVYVATPTSVREEICIEAAANGKHVLGEKPFASLASVRRIAAACRQAGVGFMDGTHFVHHPRTHEIRRRMADLTGQPHSLGTAFQFLLDDGQDIRYQQELEPMGAIGDAGWYNMRAAVEYLSPNAGIRSVSSHLRRDPDTGAAVGGAGVVVFDDESTTTWNCGFDSGGVLMELRLSGDAGTVMIDDFLGNNPDGSADYRLRQGGWAGMEAKTIRVASDKTGPVLMFEDFAAMVHENDWREASIRATERTQELVDAIWAAGLENEPG